MMRFIIIHRAFLLCTQRLGLFTPFETNEMFAVLLLLLLYSAGQMHLSFRPSVLRHGKNYYIHIYVYTCGILAPNTARTQQ